MPPWIIASVFGLVAIAAVWGIYRGLATGITDRGLWKFKVDESPLGFFLTLLVKAVVLCFAVAVVLHVVGLSSFDPIIETRKRLPSFVSNPNHR